MFDLSKSDAINSAASWKEQVDQNAQLPDGSSLPIVLVGNKLDLLRAECGGREDVDASINQECSLEKYAEEFGFSDVVCTSAKSGEGVADAFRALMRNVLQRDLKGGDFEESRYQVGQTSLTLMHSSSSIMQPKKKCSRCKSN